MSKLKVVADDAAKDDSPKSPPQSEQQAMLSGSIALMVLVLLVAALSGLTVSIMQKHWEGEEWEALTWIAEKSPSWKISLVALFSLISLVFAVFTDLYKSHGRLRLTVYLCILGLTLSLFLFFQTTRPKVVTDIFAYHEIQKCTFENLASDRQSLLTDPQILQLQLDCKTNLFETLWIGLIAWLAVTLATLLGLKSDLMAVIRQWAGKDPESGKDKPR